MVSWCTDSARTDLFIYSLRKLWKLGCCMTTSWNGNAFHITDPLWEESIGHRYFPYTCAVVRSFDAFFWDSLNKLWYKHCICLWLVMPVKGPSDWLCYHVFSGYQPKYSSSFPSFQYAILQVYRGPHEACCSRFRLPYIYNNLDLPYRFPFLREDDLFCILGIEYWLWEHHVDIIRYVGIINCEKLRVCIPCYLETNTFS